LIADGRRIEMERGRGECRNRPIRRLWQKRGVGVGRGDTKEGRE